MRGGEKVEDGGREEGPDGEGPEGDQGDHGGGQGDNKQVLRTIMLIKCDHDKRKFRSRRNI